MVLDYMYTSFLLDKITLQINEAGKTAMAASRL